MNVQQAILTAMEDILGLEQQEMLENLDLDLIENGLVDSLGIVSLITEVEGHIHHKIAIKQIAPDSFRTVNLLAAAIEKQLG